MFGKVKYGKSCTFDACSKVCFPSHQQVNYFIFDELFVSFTVICIPLKNSNDSQIM